MRASGKALALAGPLLAAGLAFAPSPSRAIGALHTFQLGSAAAQPASLQASSTPEPLATPTKSFLSSAGDGSAGGAITLTFGNAKSLLKRGPVDKLTSATDDGVCLYKIGGTSNCGRLKADRRSIGSSKPGSAKQTSINITFDRDVQLFSYAYGLLSLGKRSANPTGLSWAASADSSTETLIGKSANTVYSFANQFVVKAFQPVTIAGFGGGAGGANTQVWLDQLQVREVPAAAPSGVPGPLPLFGAGMAFAWSRRLRSRISSAQGI